MSKGTLYKNLCFLARADPGAITHLLEEARRTHGDCTARAWSKELGRIQIADRLLIADMMCDPGAGMCIFGPDDIIHNVNETMALALRANRMDLVGTYVWDHFTPGQVVRRKLVARQVWDTGRPVRYTDRSIAGHPLESITIPMSNGCLMVLFRPIAQSRAFDGAFAPREIEKPQRRAPGRG